MSRLMADNSASRNPFADPAGLSFADLIRRLREDNAVPERERNNGAWALRVVARAIGSDPAAIPAHPAFLRKALAHAAPAAAGVSRLAWNNARSLVGKTL